MIDQIDSARKAGRKRGKLIGETVAEFVDLGRTTFMVDSSPSCPDFRELLLSIRRYPMAWFEAYVVQFRLLTGEKSP